MAVILLPETPATVADMTHCERKLPSQSAAQELAFSATFCLHSSGAR